MPALWPLTAQNVTTANADVLNLLSPFLSLNATATGQTTLSSNLAQAISVNNNATTAQQSLAISDENLLGSASNTLADYPGGTKTTYGIVGVAANLGGTIPNGPVVNGLTPSQSAGGLGTVLGAIYDTGVNANANGNAASLPNTVNLLTTAYGSLTSPSLGVAKNYFANGTSNGTTAAVAPAGSTLPTFNGLPNTANSVYDVAYGVKNTSAGQQPEGDSRPYQVSPSKITLYDPSLNQASSSNNLLTNPSFPSGHTTYAYTESILLAMLVPQEYQSMTSRAAQYANSRIVLGAHYPLDIIGSRSLAAEQLAQAFTNPAYINNAATTGTAINLPSLFTAASTELNSYLTTNLPASCGTTLTACAASAANQNSLSPSAANAATYASDLNYGLPTLSYALAPREQAAAGGPDASILLATVYGGSTSAAQTLAPNGGIDGNLSTNTVNQIIVNTEGQALSSFYGTSLSYWSRINLNAAAGYFSGAIGVLNLASTDVVNEPVTIAATGVIVDNGKINGATTVESGGVLGGTGSVTGATTIQSGGMLAPGGFTAAGVPSTAGALALAGSLTFNPGSTYTVQVGSSASSVTNVTGAATLGGAAVAADFALGSTFAQKYKILNAASISGAFGSVSDVGLPSGLTDTVTYVPSAAYLTLSIGAAQSGATSTNQLAVVGALNGALAANGSLPIGFASLNGATLSQATGEAGAAAHEAALVTAGGFIKSFFNGGLSDPTSPGGHTGADIAMFYADSPLPTHKGGAVDALPTPFTPYWTVWSQTFGAAEWIGGNTTAGTNATTDRSLAEMVGAEYRISRDTAFGFGFGGGSTAFNVANGLGGGHYDFGQLGGYGVHEFNNNVYVSGAVVGGFGNVRTNRTSPGGTLQASFDANNISGRAEIGDHFKGSWAFLTPYAAVQTTNVWLPAYTETPTSAFALNYASQSVTDTTTELGFRVSQTLAPQGASVVTLGGQLAWLHDFNPDQSANVSFASFPGSNFTVLSAAPAANSGFASGGAKVTFGNGFAVEGRVDGQFAANFHAVGGRGTVSYSW